MWFQPAMDLTTPLLLLESTDYRDPSTEHHADLAQRPGLARSSITARLPAPTLEALFRGCENRPDKSQPIRRRVRQERPGRWLYANAGSENIQPRERVCRN